MNTQAEDNGDQLFITLAKDSTLRNNGISNIEFSEYKEKYDDEIGQLRLYRNYIGDGKANENAHTLQIRAHQPLNRGNKSRNLCASISLSDSDILAIADHVEKNRKEHGTVLLNTHNVETDISETENYLIDKLARIKCLLDQQFQTKDELIPGPIVGIYEIIEEAQGGE